LAYFFVIYSTKVFPAVKQFTPDYFDRQFEVQVSIGSMDQSLSQGTLKDLVVVLISLTVPFIILFFFFLGLLLFYLWVPILALTSMLPSVIRYYTGIEAIERCASLRPLPFPMAVLIQTLKSPKDLL
jgi:hypothetical protein